MPEEPTILNRPAGRALDQGIQAGGSFIRIARLRAEGYDYLDKSGSGLEALRALAPNADLFTFFQPPSDPAPWHEFYRETQALAAISLESYEKWWKTQINDKTRNMVRKAGKKGVVLQRVELDDALVRGIQKLYNECRVRQGKPFKHYGKDLETLRREHSSFLGVSEFWGAFSGGELIGFVKIIFGDGWANIMNILSLLRERDKAPTNALLAKGVERCCERGIRVFQYGIWSRRSFGDFKTHHGFQRFEVPRYYVPLTGPGRFAVKLGFHRRLQDRVPEKLMDQYVRWRARWYDFRYRKNLASQGQ